MNTDRVAIFLLGRIFPTQGLNQHLLCFLHFRQILCLQSHQRSPLIGYTPMWNKKFKEMSVNTYNRHLGNESRPLVILKLTITRNQIIKYCNSVFSNMTFVASSVSSAAHRHPTLCDPMDCSVPKLPVHHQFLELTQIHVHQVSDAILASHPLLSPSSPTFNLS